MENSHQNYQKGFVSLSADDIGRGVRVCWEGGGAANLSMCDKEDVQYSSTPQSKKAEVQIRRDLCFSLILSECLFAVHRSYGDSYLVGLEVQFTFFCNPVISNHMNEEEYCMLFYSFMSTCTLNGCWKVQNVFFKF